MTKNKKCNISHCKAGCCGIVPIPNKVIDQNLAFIQRPYIRIPVDEFMGLENSGCSAVYDNKTKRCAFLTQDYRCAIYSERPEVCRLFGTKNIPGLQCPHLK